MYSTGMYTQYLAITYNGKESENKTKSTHILKKKIINKK